MPEIWMGPPRSETHGEGLIPLVPMRSRKGKVNLCGVSCTVEKHPERQRFKVGEWEHSIPNPQPSFGWHVADYGTEEALEK